jgi:nucleotide-binding universal stress UspA family protein
LETAAKVAACLKAELRGVYVEDIDLVRTAALPFACAISSSGQAQRLTPDALERQLRRQAETARRAIEAAGSRSRVTWSFSVVRGAVRREIARAAASAAIVSVGMAGWSVVRGGRLGSVPRTLLHEGTASLLMVERDEFDGTLGVVYDGTAAADRALALAAALAGSGRVHVFMTADAADLRQSVAERLRSGGAASFTVRLEVLPPGGLVAAIEALRRSDAHAVLLPVTFLPEDIQARGMDVARLNRSVFVVR